LRRFLPPVAAKLADPGAERVRHSHDQRIRELQSVQIMGGALVSDIALPDGVDVFIPHGLGRKARAFMTPPRATSSATTGRIREVRTGSVDPERYICLRADGWGETVYLDIWCF
jgi:hypothetical protein